MNVMLDFICLAPVDLPGAHRKRQNAKWKQNPCSQCASTPQTLVIQTDRPRSLRNRCVIELFCGVICVETLPF